VELYFLYCYRSVKRTGPITTVVLKTASQPRVVLHQRSILSSVSRFESPYLVFHMIMESSSVFLHDATMVSPWPLLFFGEKLDIVEFEKNHRIRVDELIRINCFKKTAVLIQVSRTFVCLLGTTNFVNIQSSLTFCIVLYFFNFKD